jgi:hypothetical protein
VRPPPRPGHDPRSCRERDRPCPAGRRRPPGPAGACRRTDRRGRPTSRGAPPARARCPARPSEAGRPPRRDRRGRCRRAPGPDRPASRRPADGGTHRPRETRASGACPRDARASGGQRRCRWPRRTASTRPARRTLARSATAAASSPWATPSTPASGNWRTRCRSPATRASWPTGPGAPATMAPRRSSPVSARPGRRCPRGCDSRRSPSPVRPADSRPEGRGSGRCRC